MNTLEKLFGSAARVKLLRLFLLSPEKVFIPQEAANILKILSRGAVREIKFLYSLDFIKKGNRTDLVKIKIGRKEKWIKRKTKGYVFSPAFPFMLALRNLLVTASPISREKMAKFFRSRGKIKLVALGGIFSDDLVGGFAGGDPARLDILVVGNVKKRQVEGFIKNLESEIGKELNWTALTHLEFDNRMSMQDRLLRDLFDYPHEFLINKLGLE